MNIIFVCNSKYHRTTLKKILNNHGLKFKYFTNTKLCVNVGFSCLVIPITPPPPPPPPPPPALIQQIVIIHQSLQKY